jgi:uncharacterized repeat protein (TIGR01451 family)
VSNFMGPPQTTSDPVDNDLAKEQALGAIDFGAVYSAYLRVDMTYSVNSNKIIFAITVTNDGPADAVDAILTDLLPDSAAIVSVIFT